MRMQLFPISFGLRLSRYRDPVFSSSVRPSVNICHSIASTLLSMSVTLKPLRYVGKTLHKYKALSDNKVL